MTMIQAIGAAGTLRTIDMARADKARGPVSTPAPAEGATAAATLLNPAADLAAQGAPIDTDRVAQLRAAIADGSYKIDPQAIADRMIALDLPA